ncbi:unnamed protein product [Caenorhabditis angaria]|uniref:Seven TM Receptor n=1 Tax=Caenorhabditis angaria TaxID=860376 RepID=A0A9P1MVJ1_9PELO|nr:unnamed protein product [Caenorhabditis angaria]
MGIFLTFLDVLIHPIVYSYNCSFIFFSLETFFGAPKIVKTLLLSSYSGMHACTMSFVAIQFIYRYFILINSSKISWFEKKKLYLWIFYSLSIWILWVTVASLTLMNDKYAIEYYRNKIFAIYRSNIDEISSYIVVAYEIDSMTNEKKVKIPHLLCMIILSSILASQYFIIVFCTIRMKLKMKEKLELFSTSQRRLQKQLYKVLVFQLITPSLIIHLPFLPLFIIPFLNIQIDIETSFLIAGVSSYPFIDTLFLLLMVSEYRYGFRNLFRCTGVTETRSSHLA